VTHDQSEALSLGQRVAVLDAGELRQVGDPETVYDRPADRFVARFVGNPPMNLVPVAVADGALRGPGEIVLPLPPGCGGPTLEGESVVAGFRSEGARCPAGERSGFRAVLDAVEGVGHERIWQLRAGAQPLVVRPQAGTRGTPGETVRVAVSPLAVRLFDSSSGRAL